MVWVRVHSLRPAGRDAPAASCPCPWARGLGFLGEAAWEQGLLFKERQWGRLSTQKSGPEERKRIGQWRDICEVACLADRFLLQMGQAEGSISPGVWAQGRGAGHSGPHLWGHSLSMLHSLPQLSLVLVRKCFSGCYFLILPSPLFSFLLFRKMMESHVCQSRGLSGNTLCSFLCWPGGLPVVRVTGIL